MSSFRAPRAGLAKEESQKIEANFDIENARLCLKWLQQLSGETPNIDLPDDRRKAIDTAYAAIKDGMYLIKAVNLALPPEDKLDLSKRTFKPTDSEIFRSARERERIEIFLDKCLDVGLAETMIFQIDCLYERTNLSQVMSTIRSLGIEAQTKPWYNGPVMWPMKSSEIIEKHASRPVKSKKPPGLGIGIEFNKAKCND
ncbi:myophilin-like isoform X2 [Argonauta hians]